MAITYNTGATADSGSGSGTTQNITVPAGVLANDVVLLVAQHITLTGTPATLSVSSTGTTPTAAGGTNNPATGSEGLPASVTGQVWYFVASGTDAGKVITVTASGAGFRTLALAAYTGAATTTPVDVIAGAFGGANTASVTCPTLSTVTSGDWAVYLGGGAAEGANLTGPAGATSRQSDVSSANIAAAILDSNGSVGGSGTSIGGGTFGTASATNSLLTAFTVGLKAAGAGTSHAGAAALSGSGTFTAGAQKTIPGAAALSGSGTLTASGLDIGPFSAVFVSTDAHGVQTWTVTSVLNSPSTSTLRILPPSHPNHGYRHSFLFALPVSTGVDATFGDPPTVIGQDLGAHNAYNTTLVVPSFPIQPWYADNPLNPDQSQESFMLALAAWMKTSSFAQGGEKNYLIGFSKSGLGGQGLIFHRPDIWRMCASWDAPFMMTDFDGTDPTFGGTVGGSPDASYGTSANFTGNYELSAAHLSAWGTAGGFTTARKLWIGGYFSFQSDVNAYMSALTTAGILFNGAHDTLDVSHAWHDGWVADALAFMMPDSAVLAGLSGSGTFSAAATRPVHGAAALSGTGTLTAVRGVSAPGVLTASSAPLGVLTASTGG